MIRIDTRHFFLALFHGEPNVEVILKSTVNRQQTAIKTTYISIGGNAGLAVIKWLTGYFGNSYALIVMHVSR